MCIYLYLYLFPERERETERINGYIPNKIQYEYIPDKILHFFQLTLLISHNLTHSMLGTKDAKMKKDTILKEFMISSEIRYYFHVEFSVVDILSNQKH